MRNVLLVTGLGLAIALFVPAAQAADCSKVVEIPLAAPADKEALACVALRAKLVHDQNMELLRAAYDAATPAVYILRFSSDRHIVTLDRTSGSDVEYNREHFDDDTLQHTEVIVTGSPRYMLAVSAYADLASNNAQHRPASLTELVDNVATPNAIVAARWPSSLKMPAAVVAEGK